MNGNALLNSLQGGFKTTSSQNSADYTKPLKSSNGDPFDLQLVSPGLSIKLIRIFQFSFLKFSFRFLFDFRLVFNGLPWGVHWNSNIFFQKVHVESQ